MLRSLAVSLGLTVLLEEGFALCWGLRGRRELTVVALVNVLTNPAVVLARHTAVGLWGWPAPPVTAALEALAVLAEWRCCRACSEQLSGPSCSPCWPTPFPTVRGSYCSLFYK